MSKKMSEARKKQWSNVEASERSKRMSELASMRWEGVSTEERREHAMKLVVARQKLTVEGVESSKVDISIT